jgi:uncharacterized membrane protein YeiB
MVDALHGFAVMAIIMVHNLEHFIFPVYPESGPAWLDALDSGVFCVVFSLFAGKAYAIFALLFGFTFYLQSNNARRRGSTLATASCGAWCCWPVSPRSTPPSSRPAMCSCSLPLWA